MQQQGCRAAQVLSGCHAHFSNTHVTPSPAAFASLLPQIAKLLIIPFVCFVERFYLGRVFSRETVASIGVVVLVRRVAKRD